MIKIRFLAYIYLSIAILISSSQAHDKIKVGAGSLLEGYYSIGLKFCRYLSRANKNIPCEVVPTTGSIENLKLLHRGEIDFAFSLSNIALDSYYAKGHFIRKKPFTDMYQILKLHDETFTVLVKDDDKILVFSDLDGKKISNGPPRSDSTALYKELESYYDFKNPPTDIELTHEDYAREFCAGNIDAIIMMTGHPSSLVNFITHSCESDFLTIDNDKLDLLIKDNPHYKKVTLPAGKYPGITQDQTTLATSAILVSAKHVDPDIVQNFLDLLPKVAGHFRSSHPSLYDISDDDLRKDFVLPNFGVNNSNKIINED